MSFMGKRSRANLFGLLAQTLDHGLHGLDVLFLLIAALVLGIDALEMLFVLVAILFDILLFEILVGLVHAISGAHDVAGGSHMCKHDENDGEANKQRRRRRCGWCWRRVGPFGVHRLEQISHRPVLLLVLRSACFSA